MAIRSEERRKEELESWIDCTEWRKYRNSVDRKSRVMDRSGKVVDRKVKAPERTGQARNRSQSEGKAVAFRPEELRATERSVEVKERDQSDG